MKSWFLDCYHYGAWGGRLCPVASYGPGTLTDIKELDKRITWHFHRTEITQDTKGQSPTRLGVMKP